MKQWIDTNSEGPLAEYENFVTFKEKFEELIALTEEVKESLSVGEMEKSEQTYNRIVEVIKKGKSAIRTLGYDISEE